MKPEQSVAAIGIALALLAIAPARAEQVRTPKVDSQIDDDFRQKVLSEPGMAKAMHDLFAGTAMRIVRLERMVAIGQLCRVLSQQDADEILANGRAELDDSRSMLTDGDRIWASTYLAGLRVGATQSADLREVTDEPGCAKFSVPGGALTRIMTWTNKPQETSPGVRASPRTLP